MIQVDTAELGYDEAGCHAAYSVRLSPSPSRPHRQGTRGTAKASHEEWRRHERVVASEPLEEQLALVFGFRDTRERIEARVQAVLVRARANK